MFSMPLSIKLEVKLCSASGKNVTAVLAGAKSFSILYHVLVGSTAKLTENPGKTWYKIVQKFAPATLSQHSMWSNPGKG